MAEEAKQLGALLVHYSTDYVFDGNKVRPYREDDLANAINGYGRTKLEGDRAIQRIGPPYLIFRTAWVYAPEGRNFLLTVLRLAAEKEELRIVRDETGSSTSGREIAAATASVLSQICSTANGASPWIGTKGIYHMTAAGETTWYDFAGRILDLAVGQSRGGDLFRAATGDRPLVARRIVPIATSQFPTPAQRPAYSARAHKKLHDTVGVSLPHLEAAARSVFSEGTRDTHAQVTNEEHRPRH